MLTNHLVDALKVSPPAFLASITGLWMPAVFGDVLESTHIQMSNREYIYKYTAILVDVVSTVVVAASQSLPHLSPISAITWYCRFGRVQLRLHFLLFFSSFHFIQRTTALYARNIARLPCQPYQLTCSLKWPHSIAIVISRADCDNPSS